MALWWDWLGPLAVWVPSVGGCHFDPLVVHSSLEYRGGCLPLAQEFFSCVFGFSTCAPAPHSAPPTITKWGVMCLVVCLQEAAAGFRANVAA